MAIQYDSSAQTLSLHTAHTTYQMKIGPHGFLLHTYYGPCAEGDMSYCIVPQDRGFAPAPYDAGEERGFSPDAVPLEYPCEGSGDFRFPAFDLRDAKGVSGCDLRYAKHEILPGKYALPGLPAVYADDSDAETLRVTLRDERAGVEVALLYGVLPAADTITRAAVISNTGSAPLTLQNAASVCLDFVFGDWELLHFCGRHAGERHLERLPIGQEEIVLGSRRGTSSHQHNPFVILAEAGTNEDSGPCCGAALLYSGAFSGRLGREQFGSTRLALGVQSERFDYPLAPGESFTAPEVALCYTLNGLTALSQSFHDLMRHHVCRGPWKTKRRPVLINNWEATYFDFDGEKLIAIAKQAAALGVEMMVLDDGWFGARSDDHRGLGDWVVNEEKLGGPLSSVVDKINAMGMKFGLWIEPEMVNEDSDLYRAHPDWALAIPGKKPVRGRSQLVLDFSRPEVVDAIFSRITKVLDSTHVEYIKMDMNRSLCEVYSATAGQQSQGQILYRYTLGVYDFMERLLARYPGLLLEGCSGGGGRFDAGMLYYTPQIWCSDNTDAIERIDIQYGTSFGYPISAVGSHVSVVPNEQTGRVVPLNTRAVVAMAGSFGYELDLNLLCDAEKEEVRAEVANYKAYWPLIHDGQYYRLTDPTQNREEAAWLFAAPDASEALLNVVTLNTHGNPPTRYVRCKGLDPRAAYREEATGAVYSGAALLYAGLPIPALAGEYNAFQWHFIRQA